MVFFLYYKKRKFSKKYAFDYSIVFCLSKILQICKYIRVQKDTLWRFHSFSYVGIFIKCHVQVQLFKTPILRRVLNLHM